MINEPKIPINHSKYFLMQPEEYEEENDYVITLNEANQDLSYINEK